MDDGSAATTDGNECDLRTIFTSDPPNRASTQGRSLRVDAAKRGRAGKTRESHNGTVKTGAATEGQVEAYSPERDRREKEDDACKRSTELVPVLHFGCQKVSVQMTQTMAFVCNIFPQDRVITCSNCTPPEKIA